MRERPLRIWSYFIIFIFLFVPFSVRGQGSQDDDPLEQALRWERVVFNSEDPSETHSALIEKAKCYSEAGLPSEALRTLERVRMYLLEPVEASKVLVRKSLYAKEAGDPLAALGYLEESGLSGDYPALYSVLLAQSRRFDEAKVQAMEIADSEADKEAVENLFKKAPSIRKEGTAAVLSFIPPAGQIYVGKPWRGVLAMFLNAGAAGLTIYELISHDWLTGFLGGGLLLNETFFKGNMERNIQETSSFNQHSVEEFASRLESLLSSFGASWF